MLYNLSIVQGYKLTTYTWPLLAGFRSIVESLLPTAGLYIHRWSESSCCGLLTV